MLKITILFFLSTVLIVTAGLCQEKNLLAGQTYHAIYQNPKTQELSVTGDSLFMIRKRSTVITAKAVYAINATEKRGDYLLLYVNKPPLVSKSVLIKSNLLYGVFIISFSPDITKLFLLQENNFWYASADECKKASAHIDFGNKYFFSFYNEQLFNLYKNYKPINSADSNTIKKITDELVAEAETEKDKLQNTQAGGYYGTAFMRDMMGNILIRYGFNPSTSISALDAKMQEYHIGFPGAAPAHKSFTNRNPSDTSKTFLAPVVQQ